MLAAITDNINMQADSAWATVASTSDYYPFGLEMKGRVYNDTTSYRYGFNGKEKDDKGEFGNTVYDYGFRIYNPSIAKFLSVDPLTKSYTWNSPYSFAENRVIDGIDLEGKEWSVTGKSFNFLTGETNVNLKVKIAVVNASKLSNNEQSLSYLNGQIKMLAESILSDNGNKQFKVNISAVIEFTEDKNSFFTMTLKDGSAAEINGHASKLGDTKSNSILLYLSKGGKFRDPFALARTLVHELLHTAGVRHIFDEKNEIGDAKQLGPVYGSEKDNIMNSGTNPIKTQASTSGTNISNGQREQIVNQIESDTEKLTTQNSL